MRDFIYVGCSKEEQLLYEGFRASLEKIVNFAFFSSKLEPP